MRKNGEKDVQDILILSEELLCKGYRIRAAGQLN